MPAKFQRVNLRDRVHGIVHAQGDMDDPSGRHQVREYPARKNHQRMPVRYRRVRESRIVLGGNEDGFAKRNDRNRGTVPEQIPAHGIPSVTFPVQRVRVKEREETITKLRMPIRDRRCSNAQHIAPWPMDRTARYKILRHCEVFSSVQSNDDVWIDGIHKMQPAVPLEKLPVLFRLPVAVVPVFDGDFFGRLKVRPEHRQALNALKRFPDVDALGVGDEGPVPEVKDSAVLKTSGALSIDDLLKFQTILNPPLPDQPRAVLGWEPGARTEPNAIGRS